MGDDTISPLLTMTCLGCRFRSARMCGLVGSSSRLRAWICRRVGRDRMLGGRRLVFGGLFVGVVWIWKVMEVGVVWDGLWSGSCCSSELMVVVAWFWGMEPCWCCLH